MTNLWLEPNSLAGVAEHQLGVGGRWSLSHPALTITLSPLCLWWPPSVSGLPWSGWWPGSPLWPALGGSRLSPLSPLCPPTLHSAPPPVTCSGTTGRLIPCRGWTCFREGSGFPVWLLQAPLTSCLPLAAMRAILPYIRSHFAILDTFLTTDKQCNDPLQWYRQNQNVMVMLVTWVVCSDPEANTHHDRRWSCFSRDCSRHPTLCPSRSPLKVVAKLIEWWPFFDTQTTRIDLNLSVRLRYMLKLIKQDGDSSDLVDQRGSIVLWGQVWHGRRHWGGLLPKFGHKSDSFEEIRWKCNCSLHRILIWGHSLQSY